MIDCSHDKNIYLVEMVAVLFVQWKWQLQCFYFLMVLMVFVSLIAAVG